MKPAMLARLREPVPSGDVFWRKREGRSRRAGAVGASGALLPAESARHSAADRRGDRCFLLGSD